MNIFLVKHESSTEEDSNFEVIPCIDFDTAALVMQKHVNDILRSGKFKGVNLSKVMKEQDDPDSDCQYRVTIRPDYFLIETLYGDFSEEISIEESKLVVEEEFK